MGKIKELIVERIEKAGLTDEQEQKVYDYLLNVGQKTEQLLTVGEQIDQAIIYVLQSEQQKPSKSVAEENQQLRKVLKDILNFEYGAFDRAKHFLMEK